MHLADAPGAQKSETDRHVRPRQIGRHRIYANRSGIARLSELE
jgi:hypothetical protein